jgi:hypothetical protein
MTGFWRQFLTIWGWFVVLFGAVLAGGAFAATDGPVRALFDLIGPGGASFDAHLRFATGLMGAVTIGWGLTLLVLFRATDGLGDRAGPVWRGLLVPTFAWYAIDSIISVATGFALNAVSNTILVASLLLALWRGGALKS